jgi:hypothetical protein
MSTQSKQIDWVKVFSIVTAIVFAFLWLKGCTSSSPEPQIAKVEVTVPEVKRTLESKKPVHFKLNLPKNDKSKIVKIENPINQQLVAENERLKQYAAENEKLKLAFAKETDSLKKQLAYEKAVALNNFSTKFEDENLELNLEGVVQGEVKEITPSYKIKERKVETAVKEKQVAFRMLGGVEVGNTLVLDKFAVKANLMLQNRKGNIFSASMDTNKAIWVGYSASIFSIKR